MNLFATRGIHRLTLLLIAVLTLGTAPYANASAWGPFRGFNSHPDLSETDIRDLAASGANLLRLSFNRHPLMKKEAPYDFDEKAFAKLDKILNWCEKYGVRVVIDPHTTPGTEQNTTTKPNDLLWQDEHWHDLLVKLWERIANQYKDRGDVIAGYDLLNEPASPQGFPEGGPGDWNKLVNRLAETIRQHDKVHTLIVEPPVGRDRFSRWLDRPQGMTVLKPLNDNNVVYSPHMYMPGAFTHQGVLPNMPVGKRYPGQFGMTYWDKAQLEKALQPVIDFQTRYKVPIFIGEFSASRFSGSDGDQYVADLIKIFEHYNWSWAYHDFRGSPVWDAELTTNPASSESSQRDQNAPRMQILIKAFHGALH